MNLDFFWRVLSGSFTQIVGWLAAEGQSRLLRHFEELTARADTLTVSAIPLAQRAAACPVHGDIKAENALMSLGTAVLVDWEMFGLGDPALDAAYFLVDSQAMMSSDVAAIWLDIYLARMDDERLSDRIAVYHCLLHLEKLCFLLNGLRTLTPADRASEEFRRNVAFLTATLEATWYATRKQLTVAADADSPEIHEDVAILVNS